MSIFIRESQKIHLRTCEPCEDPDQLAHSRSRSLIRLFLRRISDSQGCKVSSCVPHRLIRRQRGYPDWFVSTLGEYVRKYHYENTPIQIQCIYKFHLQKLKIFSSLEPPRRGGSNNTRNLFFSRNKKNNVYPCNPQFYYIKVGFKEVKII